MADSTSYPQIPSTVWSGVWRILHDSPSRKVDENVLAIELGVQKTASRQYLKELSRLGLFGEDGSTTELAKKWRQDGDNPEVIGQILENAYPQELRELAPADRLDRDKIVRWFISQGLGGGAAQNKAATYMRVASGVSAIEAKPQNNGAKAVRSSPRKQANTGDGVTRTAEGQKATDASGAGRNTGGESGGGRGWGPATPDLNVNIQIHISADSTAEQIDSIFSAMRKYFDGPAAS